MSSAPSLALLSPASVRSKSVVRFTEAEVEAAAEAVAEAEAEVALPLSLTALLRSDGEELSPLTRLRQRTNGRDTVYGTSHAVRNRGLCTSSATFTTHRMPHACSAGRWAAASALPRYKPGTTCTRTGSAINNLRKREKKGQK